MDATVQEKELSQTSQTEWESKRDDQLTARQTVMNVVDTFGAAFALQALADAIHHEACVTVGGEGDRLIQVAHILHDLSGLAEGNEAKA